MPADLIDALRSLAAEWDDAAPALTLDELTREHSLFDGARPSSPEVAVQSPPLHRRHWWIAAAAAAAIALVVVAVTVINGDDPDRRIQPPVDSGVTIPTSTTAAATATTSPIPLAEQLVEIQRESLDALARLESFSATVNYEVDDRSGTPLNASSQRVTVMADGRTWSEGDPELWSSYDPSTGVTRSAGLMDDGTIRYGEVAGLAAFTGQTNTFFGSFLVIPWPTVTDNAGYVTVSEVESHLGRPGWRIEMTGPLVDDDRSLEAWVIDRETGLVVEYRSHPGPVPGAMNTHTVLDDVVTDVELPTAFPGTFPDGATVSRQTTTEGFHLATVANAAREFGSPIAVPAGLPDDAIVQVVSQPDIDHPDATFFEVTADTHEGFNRIRVTTRKHVLAPGAPVPDGFTLQDGLLCDRFRTDGRCAGYETPNAIATGAFAGLPMATADSTVEITDGGVWFEVLAPDRERATATAASMRLVSP